MRTLRISIYYKITRYFQNSLSKNSKKKSILTKNSNSKFKFGKDDICGKGSLAYSEFHRELLEGVPLHLKIGDMRKEDAFIWHISDLHFGNSISLCGFLDFDFAQTSIKRVFKKFPFLKKLIFKKYLLMNHGNSEEILKQFKAIVENRVSSDDDVFIITGDLTKKGSKKEVKRYLEFKEFLAEKTKRIYDIPGNHDYWNGKPFFLTSIISIFTKNRLIRKIYSNSYLKDFFPLRNSLNNFHDKKLFLKLKNHPFAYRTFKVMDMEAILIQVDSNYRDRVAIAQGVFPIGDFYQEALSRIDANYDLKIMAVHHHLVDYLHSREGNWNYLRYEFSTRVNNAYKANKLIENLNLNLILHGHKHMQDTKIYTAQKNYGLFLAAPAAFLDDIESEDEKIGFNIIYFDKNYHHILVIEYIKNEYRCVKIERYRR